jgi:hypothetical protein
VAFAGGGQQVTGVIPRGYLPVPFFTQFFPRFKFNFRGLPIFRFDGKVSLTDINQTDKGDMSKEAKLELDGKVYS